ncbi:MAG: DUF6020 family protein [Bifidobacteriaceae bacterium]|nr:DUF6020 family protein [Bifidobacteriaceae bacterium]
MKLTSARRNTPSEGTAVPTPPVLASVITILLSIFLALCSAVGPLYRSGGSISGFGVANALILLVTACAYYCGIRWLARCFYRYSLGSMPSRWIHTAGAFLSRHCDPSGTRRKKLANSIVKITRSRTTIFVFLLIVWIWVPLLLQVSYGADLVSQKTEFTSWLHNLRAGDQPYEQGFSQADIYPIAHYLWPQHPAFLTNQHNIILTFVYGLFWRASRLALGTAAPGIIVLGVLQYIFAAGCCALTAWRFFTVRRGTRLTHKAVVLAVLAASPIIPLSTISLTKSPLFGFALVWWCGVLYEMVHTKIKNGKGAAALSRGGKWELILSGAFMLISAKYAVYIMIIEVVVLLVTSHRNWKVWIVCIALPVVIFQVFLFSLIHSGAIINGDSIESKAIQVQQIARAARDNPGAISSEDRAKLAPIFNLDVMAKVYNPSDADPVKSSGSKDKLTSYKWLTVTSSDWKQFNSAWLDIGKKAPKEYFDAFVAEFYGYFDMADPPSTSALYYSDTPYITAIFGQGYTNFPPRATFLGFLRGWSAVPVIGWYFHGNFWVILTLVFMAAQLRLRRWKELLWQLPLLIQMGVMVMSPANNFDRHMIGIVIMFAYLCIDQFRRRDTSPVAPSDRIEREPAHD